MGYAIRLPAKGVLQDKIGYLLKRPVGRPRHEVRRYYASFSYQAQSWKKPRRVVAKVEWHPGELYPRVGFIVTSLARPAGRVVAFYNQRGTAATSSESAHRCKHQVLVADQAPGGLPRRVTVTTICASGALLGLDRNDISKGCHCEEQSHEAISNKSAMSGSSR